jgi:hypothetical protein
MEATGRRIKATTLNLNAVRQDRAAKDFGSGYLEAGNVRVLTDHLFANAEDWQHARRRSLAEIRFRTSSEEA